MTVKHFSHGNESFQLDGVPEFPDDMMLFLGKVNNGTKAMRTGITRSNLSQFPSMITDLKMVMWFKSQK